MKAVLISIQPKWCKLILIDKKNLEIRKSRPKLETPFKVYIYCTVGSDILAYSEFCGYDMTNFSSDYIANGKVIGEFTCSKISAFDYAEMYEPPDWEESLGNQYYITCGDLDNSCLSYEELVGYGKEKKLYGWHISDLKIYEKPKMVSDFSKPYGTVVKAFDSPYIQRPPQSWCYVESK